MTENDVYIYLEKSCTQEAATRLAGFVMADGSII